MQIEPTLLNDCFIVFPKVFHDRRGSFFESFNQQGFERATGLEIDFVQDNQSISKRGSLRGLHLQTGAMAQSKLIRVVQGRVWDVVVDLRPRSSTFKEHFTVELNQDNNYQLFVPKGFAHGFVTLSEEAIFAYKCDNYYDKQSEAGIIYNDPDLNIDWKLPEDDLVLSDKDKQLPTLKEFLK
jgi:dTDP-4-dehydrorhamnose 3,5-epimerase